MALYKSVYYYYCVCYYTQKAITHEAERIFKIVLAGDAAVGKSSFILRLCKNKFVANLSSTLGAYNELAFRVRSYAAYCYRSSVVCVSECLSWQTPDRS